MVDLIVMIVPMVVFLILLILRTQIAITFFIAGLVGITLLRGFQSGVVTFGLASFSESSNFVLLAIPLFTLMGQFIYYSGMSSQLFDSAYKWSGKIRGSLAYATIITCTFFGACTGSSMAAVGTIGPTALREMERVNYSSHLAYGCITSGASLGIMIPPSLCFIVYGYICGVPIGPLFIAGILPGILTSMMLMLWIFFVCLRDPNLAPPSNISFSWKEKSLSTKGIWWVVLLFIVIVGGILIGLFTATEAAGMGAFTVFIILLFSGKMTWKIFVGSLKDTLRISCMIFTIIIGAKVFNTYLGLSGIPQGFCKFILELPVSPHTVLVIILFAYLPIGCFVDSVPMSFLTLPVFYPVVKTLGFDPLLFGILFTLMGQISILTPPVGMNCYVLSGIASRPLNDVFKGSVPFLIPMIVSVIILVIFPQISLFLPGLMK